MQQHAERIGRDAEPSEQRAADQRLHTRHDDDDYDGDDHDCEQAESAGHYYQRHDNHILHHNGIGWHR
jgi:hypothetical protein